MTALLYGRNADITKSKKLFVVVVNYNDKPTGIVVDKLMGEEEIVIKNIDYAADQYYIIHSATIMGTGDVGLILDIASLLDYLTMGREDSTRIILSETNHENTHR
jgi:chemotaxis protein histidine kinase CheA